MQGLSFASLKLRPETERQNILKDFLLYPITYIRLVGLLCSIIVFGCVADKVVFKSAGSSFCLYNLDNNCCNFAIAIGVLAFILCLVFLMKDVLYNVLDFSDNVTMKKLLLVVDIAVNGLWAFMWFVAFIYTADQWRKTGSISDTSITNCANSGVAFSFFSTLLWIAIVVVNAILLIRVIRSPGHPGTSGYSSFPQPPPQAASTDQPYSPPEY
ncbi:hypothetical protein EMCRGX_G028057 [Ephydatia muelleri]